MAIQENVGGTTARVEKTGEKLWNRLFIGICFANFFYYMALNAVSALTALYADYLGASSATVGIVTSLFAITALVMKVFCGPATVAFNKKAIALVFLSTMVAAFLVMGFSSTLPVLVFACLLQGVGQGFAPPTLMALASQTLPKSKLGTGIGYYSVVQVIGMALAPAMALQLYPLIGYNLTFFVAAALMGAATLVIVAIRFPEDSRRAGNRPKFSLRLDNIIAVEALAPMILLVIVSAAFSGANNFIVLFSKSVGVADISLFFTINACVMFLSRPLGGRLSDSIGARKVLIPGLLVFGVGLVLLSRSTELWQFLAAGAIYAFGLGFSQPNLQALCLKSATSERSGVASSTAFAAFDIGGIAGPIAAGYISEAVGYQGIYVASAGYCLLALLLLLLVFYRRLEAIEQGAKDSE